MSISTYRQRKAVGMVRAKPRRMDLEKARVVRRRYFAREKTQLELALEYGVSQPTIARVVANMTLIEG